MADPRDTISLVGIRPLRVTLTADNTSITYSSTAAGGSAVINRAVKLSADNTVSLTTAASHVIGKLLSVAADLRCLVQIGGFMTLPKGTNYAGAVGDRIIGDVLVAAEGYVKHVAAAGGTYAQSESNAILAGRGTVYDDSDSALVLVHLPG